jgi:hypothetical protein
MHADVTETSFQVMEYRFIAERMFGNQDHVRLTCKSGPQSEMTRMPAHNFDYLDPAV